MTKQEQFLWIVQMTILANVIASQRDLADKWHQYSGVGVTGLMADAILASERIPSELSVTEAAQGASVFELPQMGDVNLGKSALKFRLG